MPNGTLSFQVGGEGRIPKRRYVTSWYENKVALNASIKLYSPFLPCLVGFLPFSAVISAAGAEIDKDL